GFAKDFDGLRPNDSGDAGSRRFSRTAGDDRGSWVGVYGHCPGPRRRSCNSSPAGENARRSTASGSNETRAPECDAEAQRNNNAKSLQPEPASSSSSIRSSENEITHALSYLKSPPERSGRAMRSGYRNCAAAQQGSQPAWA